MLVNPPNTRKGRKTKATVLTTSSYKNQLKESIENLNKKANREPLKPDQHVSKNITTEPIEKTSKNRKVQPSKPSKKAPQTSKKMRQVTSSTECAEHTCSSFEEDPGTSKKTKPTTQSVRALNGKRKRPYLNQKLKHSKKSKLATCSAVDLSSSDSKIGEGFVSSTDDEDSTGIPLLKDSNCYYCNKTCGADLKASKWVSCFICEMIWAHKICVPKECLVFFCDSCLF